MIKDSSLIDINVRANSMSVSWNSTGAYLSMACSDKTVKIWSITGEASAREVLTVTGSSGPCYKTRFSASEPNQLLTAALDKSVRLWDVRNAQQRNVARIDLKGERVVSLEWSKDPHYFTLTETDGTVFVYDTRKLSNKASSKDALRSFALNPYVVETCQFSPDGAYLVAGCSSLVDGAGQVRVWAWDAQEAPRFHEYPAHVGPIYASQFSPDGTLLATGGSDAIVGLWQSKSMCCTHTVTRRLKFVRSVAFSHDSKFLASASEDGGIDLAKSSGASLVGIVDVPGGVEEVAFHPSRYLLACAKIDQPAPVVDMFNRRDSRGEAPPPQETSAPVVVAKLSIESAQ